MQKKQIKLFATINKKEVSHRMFEDRDKGEKDKAAVLLLYNALRIRTFGSSSKKASLTMVGNSRRPFRRYGSSKSHVSLLLTWRASTSPYTDLGNSESSGRIQEAGPMNLSGGRLSNVSVSYSHSCSITAKQPLCWFLCY